MEVVLQCHEIVFGNFRIRGIGVLHVNRAVPQRSVAEPMVDPAQLARGETVTLRQGPPAVAALDEFMRETEDQFRMGAQVAEGVDAFGGRGFPAHDQRIGVVETELGRHRHAFRRQGGTQVLRRNRPAAPENFLRNRPGVFRIDIDLPTAQRLPEDDCSAHSLPVFRGQSRIA